MNILCESCKKAFWVEKWEDVKTRLADSPDEVALLCNACYEKDLLEMVDNALQTEEDEDDC